MATNQFEVRGRADKAHRLARYLRGQGYSYTDVLEFEPHQWELASELAGLKNPPSDKTQGMVIGFLTPTPTIKDTRR